MLHNLPRIYKAHDNSGIESRVQSAILSEVQSGVHGDQPGSQSVVKSRVQISNGIIASQSDLERHRDCLQVSYTDMSRYDRQIVD
jgi:hypothetical protein